MIPGLIALAWHAQATLLVLVASLLATASELHAISPEEAASIATVTLGYPLGALSMWILQAVTGRQGPREALVAAATIALGIVAAILSIDALPFRPAVAVAGLATAFLLLFLYAALPNWRVTTLVALCVAVSGIGLLAFGTQLRALVAFQVKGGLVETRYLPTTLYTVKAVFHQRVFPVRSFTTRGGIAPVPVTGGALAPLGDDFLLAAGDGRLFAFAWPNSAGRLRLRELGLRVPVNVQAFLADADDRVNTRTFRVADILVQPAEAGYRLFASHHVWMPAEDCSVVRVSYVEGTLEALTARDPPVTWQTLFETTPCLPFKDRAVRFGGLQIGGQMALLDGRTLLLTVGDHEFDGYYAEQALSQDPGNSYGKILRISLADGASEIFSLGHRNPGGLLVDDRGRIWSTEHGPKGGDELNRIEPGGNYGWPVATYGTAYDKSSWPPNPHTGRHDRFTPPVFAWLPSIGVSGLAAAGPGMFALWEGDLLVASLTGRHLWRLRLEGERVVYQEPLEIGCRIRDVVRAGDGRLLLWCDLERALIALSEPEPAENGEVLFAQCEGCHTLDRREVAGIGPDLRGIGGRPVASKRGFAYSEALADRGGKWTRRALDAFLAAPQDFAPGTTMAFEGIDDAGQRAALIEYLLSVEN